MSDEQHYDMPDVSADLAYYVKSFITLRERKAAIEAKHAQELVPYVQAKELLERAFAKHFQDTKSDNATIKGVGNVYRGVKRHAKVSDPTAFRRHVIGGEHWDLVDMKANAPAIQAYIEKNAGPCPGVDYSEVETIGVRKA